MNINCSTPNFQRKAPVRRLVPASQLQGLRLQLTEAEMSQIKELEKCIIEIKDDIIHTRNQSSKRKYSLECGRQKKEEMEAKKNKIKMLEETIKRIKINRFTEQKRAAGLDVNA